MKKNLKYLLIIAGIFIISFITIILTSLGGMEIEDHYGDLQEIYYESTDNDIIINEKTKEFGVVNKGWKSIHLWTKINADIDLYNFAYKSNYNTTLKVYRFKNKTLNIKQINYDQLLSLIKKEKAVLVMKYSNN